MQLHDLSGASIDGWTKEGRKRLKGHQRKIEKHTRLLANKRCRKYDMDEIDNETFDLYRFNEDIPYPKEVTESIALLGQVLEDCCLPQGIVGKHCVVGTSVGRLLMVAFDYIVTQCTTWFSVNTNN